MGLFQQNSESYPFEVADWQYLFVIKDQYKTVKHAKEGSNNPTLGRIALAASYKAGKELEKKNASGGKLQKHPMISFFSTRKKDRITEFKGY